MTAFFNRLLTAHGNFNLGGLGLPFLSFPLVIRTIVRLADEIDCLKSKAEQLKTEDALLDNLEPFKQELGVSGSIAAELLDCLDIERITPVIR